MASYRLDTTQQSKLVIGIIFCYVGKILLLKGHYSCVHGSRDHHVIKAPTPTTHMPTFTHIRQAVFLMLSIYISNPIN